MLKMVPHLHNKEECHAMVPSISEVHECNKVHKRYRLLWRRKFSEDDGAQEFVLELCEWHAEEAKVVEHWGHPLVDDTLLADEELEEWIEHRYFMV